MQMETERLVVRNFRPEDWEDLYEYLSREEVLKYEPSSASSREECRKLAAERARGNSFWAVCLKVTGKMIGHVYFGRMEPFEFKTWELGYIFNPLYCGMGYATEASRRIVAYGFEQLKAHRITALCDPENSASWKLLERLGMRREGHFIKPAFFRKDSKDQPIWHNVYQYAILAEEWENIRLPHKSE